MKDTLFITAREAAEITGYTPGYIIKDLRYRKPIRRGYGTYYLPDVVRYWGVTIEHRGLVDQLADAGLL